MEKIYKPNIGQLFWVHLILILVVIIPILLILTLLDVSPAGVLIPILLILLLLVILALLVVARTVYAIGEENIVIQGAFKKYEISCGSVTKIVNTNKSQFGEAMLVLSPDRIGIFFGEDSKVSISPRDKPDALGTLRSYCPNAEYEEDFKIVNAKGAGKDAAEGGEGTNEKE